MSLFSISINFFWRVELFSASCMCCSCNSSIVISLKWVLVSFFYILNSPKKCCQNMRKVRCKITYGKSNINLLIKGNQIYLPSFIHVGRTGFLVKLSFARVTPLTSWAVIFFVFSPPVQHNIKARWNVCQFLWVFLLERRWAAIIFSLNRSTMSETRRCSIWYVRCSRQSWRERAYSAITSVFGIPSFTSEPTICMNGWKRGKRKPTQHCKHFC